MTKKQVKEILDRVLTWQPKRQEEAARVLSEMEEQDTSPYHLTDEQVAEVARSLQQVAPIQACAKCPSIRWRDSPII
jgi:hypothetical protein